MADRCYPVELRSIADELEVDGPWARSPQIEILLEAASLIERLTPKPMTLERAVEILNEREQGQVRYEIVSGHVYPFLGRNQFALEPLTEFVTVAIAEKIEREKEAANG